MHVFQLILKFNIIPAVGRIQKPGKDFREFCCRYSLLFIYFPVMVMIYSSEKKLWNGWND